MASLVYFSSQSGNTHRFVTKTGLPAHRIPTSPKDGNLKVRDPFVLVMPTFAGEDGRGAVPKQVMRFLNDPDNRALLKGVIGSGNTNFGPMFAIGGRVVATKCRVPLLYKFELLGTDEDVQNVRNGMERKWNIFAH